MKNANIENLLNAVGALYILNLYYQNETFWYESPMHDKREYKPTGDSNIFSPQICDATHITIAVNMGDSKNEEIKNPSLEKSIYIIKFRENAFLEIHQGMCNDNLEAMLTMVNSPKYKNYIDLHLEEKGCSVGDIAEKIGFSATDFFIHGTFAEKFNKLYNHKEIIINKHCNIYPELEYRRYLAEDEVKNRIMEFIKDWTIS